MIAMMGIVETKAKKPTLPMNLAMSDAADAPAK